MSSKAVILLLTLISVPGLAATVEVHMKQSGAKFVFVPESLSIKKGDSVKWVNDDPSKQMHTATSGKVVKGSPKPDGLFDSKFLMNGKSFEFKFDKAGTFDYYCLPHIAMGMVGKITVK